MITLTLTPAATTLTLAELAHHGNVSEPALGALGPAGRWLLLIRDSVEDAAMTGAKWGDTWEAAHDIADGLVPVVTAEAWGIFTELAAWTRLENMDDAASLYPAPGDEGVSWKLPLTVLHMVAVDIISALVEDVCPTHCPECGFDGRH